MAYERTAWATGDVVTAERLNKMEGGIAASPLDGMSLAFLGDSWCAGSGDGAGGWARLVGEAFPGATVTNKGHYGADWAQAAGFHCPHSGDATDPLPDELDYLVVEAYTNGLYAEPVEQDGKRGVIDKFGRLKRFGSASDAHWDGDAAWQAAYPGDTATYAAECDWVLGSLARRYAGGGTRLLVIAPYRAPSQWPKSAGEHASGEGFAEFLPAVGALAAKWGYDFLDRFTTSPIPSWSWDASVPYMWHKDGGEVDATHLGLAGNRRVLGPIVDAILAL